MQQPILRIPGLFGTHLRDRLLCLLTLMPDVHLRGAARILDATPSETSKVVAALERVGIIASRRVGTTRVISLNPRWYAAAELRPLLARMAEADDELADRLNELRTRPRRIGKTL